MKYYLFTFFIVSVTVAIGSTIAVFAIRAISVLSGFDVYIIDDGAQVGQLLMVSQFVDEQIACFGCITGTAYVNTHVCHARNQLGVGHHTDGSGIEYHIVEFLFQPVDSLYQRVACHQFGRVGRDGTAGQDVQVGGDIGLLQQRHQVGVFRVGKVTGDTVFLMRHLEGFVQSRLADIQPHDDHFLAQQGKADGKVGSHK